MDLRAVLAVVWSLVLVVVFSPAVVVAGGAGEEGVVDSEKLAIGGQNLAPWANGLLNFTPVALGSADSPPEAKLPLVLAAKKTRRLDVLRKFKYYRGGWDITNKHYWTSVGSTGAGAFILALLWFVSFGLALGVRHCYKWCVSINKRDSHFSQQIRLILLLIFTCTALTGCILLSIGQDEFHGEMLHTLNFVVNQTDFTVQILTNVTGFLSLAKTINVDQILLPADVQNQIVKLNLDLDNAASMLSDKMNGNSGKIRQVLYEVAISDTCTAMGEWVNNPHAETALSNILPCVAERTTNMTFYQSKRVTRELVNVVNTVIGTIANSNKIPPENQYNQSGPLMPSLCSPYDSKLNDRQCDPQEVSFTNASMVWLNYTCTVSASGSCVSSGRATPDMYRQLVAAVNASYALDHYAPFLLSLQDCNFVRDIFNTITAHYCPCLEHDLVGVNAGLGMITAGVMLCLILWIIYANRPQREEVFAELSEVKVAKGTTAPGA